MKLLTIVGARPQFIKAAVISRAVAEHQSGVQEVIAHTGQHYDANMSDVFFDELNIPRPDYNLNIGGGTHGQNTGRMIESLEVIMQKERPDWVLVYGDTDSTLAGALAAAKLHIPVAHVEAGLRSFNRRMPEEINRVLTDHIGSLLFAPTETGRTNLRNEGVAEDKIHVVGDVMYDAALYYRDRACHPLWFDDLGLTSGEYILATIHRAENTDDPVRLAGILRGLELAGKPVILPLHPRTRSKVLEFGLSLSALIHVIEPVGYLEMVWLESNAAMIATDSGGVQKEAYFFGKPCVTLRDETEWVELVESGRNVLAGADAGKIASLLRNIAPSFSAANLFGDGNSSKKILSKILQERLP